MSTRHMTLITILDFFERSYVAPYSCNDSQLGLNWFRIYVGGAGGGAFRTHTLPGYLMSKKPDWLGLNLLHIRSGNGRRHLRCKNLNGCQYKSEITRALQQTSVSYWYHYYYYCYCQLFFICNFRFHLFFSRVKQRTDKTQCLQHSLGLSIF